MQTGETTKLLREQFNNLHLMEKLLTWKPPPNYFNYASFNILCEIKKKQNIIPNEFF